MDKRDRDLYRDHGFMLLGGALPSQSSAIGPFAFEEVSQHSPMNPQPRPTSPQSPDQPKRRGGCGCGGGTKKN